MRPCGSCRSSCTGALDRGPSVSLEADAGANFPLSDYEVLAGSTVLYHSAVVGVFRCFGGLHSVLVIVADASGHVLLMTDVASTFHEATVNALPEQPSSSELEALLKAHLGFIWRVFRRMGLCPADADDAAQQGFICLMNCCLNSPKNCAESLCWQRSRNWRSQR